ncbi:PAS domain-containing protein [Patescibacteria group bacterium]
MKDKKITEKYYKVLTETSPDCIKLFDVDGNILYMNPSGLEEHHIKTLEGADTKDFEYLLSIQGEDKVKFKQALKDAAMGKISTIEITHTPGKATREICLETIAPVKDKNNKVIGIFGVSRDITKIKKTEKKLMDIQKNLELEVEKQTKDLKMKMTDLERMNKLMLGRELEMIELKKEIKKT